MAGDDKLGKTSSSSKGKKRVGNYVFGGTIGAGSYGTVKLATHTLTNEKVAVKIFKKGTELLDVERFHREIHALKSLDHPNVVRLLEILETSSRIYLVMEYVKGKELFDFIVDNESLTEQQACYLFRQLLEGIAFCHDKSVVHRDLKPENIIVTENLTVKIVDFGFANMVTQTSMMATPCGSPYYAAPEVLSGKEYSGIGVDVWSLGVILYVCVAGYLPFDDDNVAVLFNYIKAGDYEIPESVSADFIDIISRMLVVDTKRRSTVRNLLKHPWVTETLAGCELPRNVEIEPRDLTKPDPELLQRMPEFGFTPAQVTEHLQGNSRNAITATYYLLFERRLLSTPGHSTSAPDFTIRTHRKGVTPALHLKNLPKPGDTDTGGLSSRRTHRSLASTRSGRHTPRGTLTGHDDVDDPELGDARPVSPMGVPMTRQVSDDASGGEAPRAERQLGGNDGDVTVPKSQAQDGSEMAAKAIAKAEQALKQRPGSAARKRASTINSPRVGGGDGGGGKGSGTPSPSGAVPNGNKFSLERQAVAGASGHRPSSALGGSRQSSGRRTPEMGIPPPTDTLRKILSAPEKAGTYLPPIAAAEVSWDDVDEDPSAPSNVTRGAGPSVGMAKNPKDAKGISTSSPSAFSTGKAGGGNSNSPGNSGANGSNGSSPTISARPGSASRKSFADPESLRRGAAQVIGGAASPVGTSGSSVGVSGGPGGVQRRRPSLTGLRPLDSHQGGRSASPSPGSPGGTVLSMLSAVGPQESAIRGGGIRVDGGRSRTASPLPPPT